MEVLLRPLVPCPCSVFTFGEDFFDPVLPRLFPGLRTASFFAFNLVEERAWFVFSLGAALRFLGLRFLKPPESRLSSRISFSRSSSSSPLFRTHGKFEDILKEPSLVWPHPPQWPLALIHGARDWCRMKRGKPPKLEG